ACSRRRNGAPDSRALRAGADRARSVVGIRCGHVPDHRIHVRLLHQALRAVRLKDSEKDMKLGLIGLPKSGKTTIFNALTGSRAAVTAYAAKAEPNLAVVSVGDPRVVRLVQMYRPKKTVYATIEVVDFVGLEEARSNKDALSSDVVQL